MRIVKIILFNILVLVSVFFVLEYVSYKISAYNVMKNSNKELLKVCPIPSFLETYRGSYGNQTIQFLMKYYKNGTMEYFRPAFGAEYKKPSIIVFGCSFAYGTLLNDNQTFSYKLSEAAKRPVYTRALEACGMQHMLYFLQDEQFYNNIKVPPEYIVYVFISDHLDRLSKNIFPGVFSCNGLNLMYKIDSYGLALKKALPSIFYRSYTAKKILEALDNKYSETDKTKIYNDFALANEIFLESKRIIQEHYPDSKFVILRYNEEYDERDIPFLWNVLESEGFIVLNSKDLIGRLYNHDDTAEDGIHPNEHAWDLLVPQLVKKLDL